LTGNEVEMSLAQMILGLAMIFIGWHFIDGDSLATGGFIVTIGVLVSLGALMQAAIDDVLGTEHRQDPE
jgi:hypothetical protein